MKIEWGSVKVQNCKTAQSAKVGIGTSRLLHAPFYGRKPFGPNMYDWKPKQGIGCLSPPSSYVWGDGHNKSDIERSNQRENSPTSTLCNCNLCGNVIGVFEKTIKYSAQILYRFWHPMNIDETSDS